MEFGSVTQKLEYEERFDTSGNTSESSNRTPSIESWEYGTGKSSLLYFFTDLNNHSWGWQSLDVGFRFCQCRWIVESACFLSLSFAKFWFSFFLEAKPAGLICGGIDEENEDDVSMLKKGKKRRILFTKVRKKNWNQILNHNFNAIKCFRGYIVYLLNAPFSHKATRLVVNYQKWRFYGDTSYIHTLRRICLRAKGNSGA